MSPLHLACGSGLADVVQYLVQKGVDAACIDNNGRGVLQRAWGISSDNRRLYKWLLANAVDNDGNPLKDTYGKGRDILDRSRGSFQQNYRQGVSFTSTASSSGHKRRKL